VISIAVCPPARLPVMVRLSSHVPSRCKSARSSNVDTSWNPTSTRGVVPGDYASPVARPGTALSSTRLTVLLLRGTRSAPTQQELRSRRDSWWEGARREADKEGGYRSPEKTDQIPIPVLQSSVLSKRLYLASGSNRSRLTEKGGSRRKLMPMQSRRKKPVQQGPTVQDEEGLDCHDKGSTVQDEEGLDCHEDFPTVQDDEGLDCHEKGPTVQDEEGLDCHEQVVFGRKRSPKAACRARRKHRQTVRRADKRRKDQRFSRATLTDYGPEPIHLTNMAQGRRLEQYEYH
jgi:hypothetical protein